jgi:hypothetical protein
MLKLEHKYQWTLRLCACVVHVYDTAQAATAALKALQEARYAAAAAAAVGYHGHNGALDHLVL